MAKKPKRTPSGIIQDMPFERYLAEDGINASAIVAGRVSMLHMHHAITTPKPATAAMRMGTLIHAAILEPERFARVIHVYDGTRRGKVWDAFLDGKDPDYIVSPTQHAALLRISASVHGNRHAHALLTDTAVEVSLFWTSGRYGECKARVDAFTNYPVPGIVDIKSTARIAPDAFSRTAANMGYDIKLGWYQIGVEAMTGARFPPVHIICVEQGDPYDCVVYKVPQPILDHGRELAEGIAMQYHIATKLGRYPGVSDEIETLDFSVWAMPEEDLDFTGCE